MIRLRPGRFAALCGASLALFSLALPARVDASTDEQNPSGLPPYLADRGRGMATSQFGTYVRKGEWLVYAFHEYTRTSGFEYAPAQLGSAGNQEQPRTTTQPQDLLR